MTKTKFVYNEATCAYEPVIPDTKSRIFKALAYLLGATLVAAGMLFGYYRYNPTPKEELLKSERARLDMHWQLLQHEVKLINHTLAELARDDHELREILELKDLPEEIRTAGIGGDQLLNDLQQQNLKFEELIVDTYKKIDKVKAQLTIQGLSLDTLAKYARERDRYWAHIPAIQPVDHEDLRRFSPIYGMRFNPVLKKWMPHKGLDFMGRPGVPIYATGDGVVVLARMTSGGFGNLVEIDHGYGYRTRYAHLNKTKPFNVKVGDRVKRGQVIGYMGTTGRSAGVHLHYEVLKDGVQVNPMGYFQLDLDTESYHKLLKLAKENTQPLDY